MFILFTTKHGIVLRWKDAGITSERKSVTLKQYGWTMHTNCGPAGYAKASVTNRNKLMLEIVGTDKRLKRIHSGIRSRGETLSKDN